MLKENSVSKDLSILVDNKVIGSASSTTQQNGFTNITINIQDTKFLLDSEEARNNIKAAFDEAIESSRTMLEASQVEGGE